MSNAWWYLTIRRYSGSGPPEEIGRRVREGLLLALRQQAGFRAFFAARLTAAAVACSRSACSTNGMA
jgi:hypothetical protein